MTAVLDTVIVGAGFAGLGAAIKLKEAGVDDLAILERSHEVGGTWRDNRYPGAACDIPSVLYSFSFAPNPNWSRAYSPSEEIHRYVKSLVDRFDLGPHLRFDTTVTGARFDELAGHWEIAIQGAETLLARTVVMAPGPLSNASFPSMRGIETYQGHKILSAHWDQGYDFTGKRVAVIGTGASAVQIIPELVKQAEHVTVFQRTPGWVLPRGDHATPSAVKALFRSIPLSQKAVRTATFWGAETMATALVWPTPVTSVLERISKLHLRLQVKDPWLRRQLTPDFRAGCKRMLMSDDYYPALQQDNCKLITWPIATISPDGVRTAAGIEHQVDCIVFATGYDVAKNGSPVPIHGLGGRSLADEWADGVYGYKSVHVAGYPNLYFTTGPNSGPGHNSLLVYLEGQLAYLTKNITKVLSEDLCYLDVKPGVQERYNEALQKRLSKTTWNSGCQSWYLTEDGFNGTMYPGFATQYLRQLARLRSKDYFAIPFPAVAEDGQRSRAPVGVGA